MMETVHRRAELKFPQVATASHLQSGADSTPVKLRQNIVSSPYSGMLDASSTQAYVPDGKNRVSLYYLIKIIIVKAPLSFQIVRSLIRKIDYLPPSLSQFFASLLLEGGYHCLYCVLEDLPAIYLI